MFSLEKILKQIRRGESQQALASLCEHETDHKNDADPSTYWSLRLARIQATILSWLPVVGNGQRGLPNASLDFSEWDRQISGLIAEDPFPWPERPPGVVRFIRSRYANLLKQLRARSLPYRLGAITGCIIGLALMPLNYLFIRPIIAPLLRKHRERRRLAFLKKRIGEYDEDFFACVSALILDLPEKGAKARLQVERDILEANRIRRGLHDYTWIAAFCLDAASLAAYSGHGQKDAQHLSSFLQTNAERLIEELENMVEYRPILTQILRGMVVWECLLLAKLRTILALNSTAAPQLDLSICEDGVMHVLNNNEVFISSFWSGDRPMQRGLLQIVCMLLSMERDVREIAKRLPHDEGVPLFECAIYGNLAITYSNFLVATKARALCRQCAEIHKRKKETLLRAFESVSGELHVDSVDMYNVSLFEKEVQGALFFNPLELHPTLIHSTLDAITQLIDKGKKLVAAKPILPPPLQSAFFTTLVQARLVKIGLLRTQTLSQGNFNEVRQEISAFRRILNSTPFPKKIFLSEYGGKTMETDAHSFIRYVEIYLELESALLSMTEERDCSFAAERRIAALLMSVSRQAPFPHIRGYYAGLMNSHMARMYAQEAGKLEGRDDRRAQLLYSRAADLIAESELGGGAGQQSALETLWRCKRNLLGIKPLIARHRIQDAISRLRNIVPLTRSLPNRFRRLDNLVPAGSMGMLAEDANLLNLQVQSLLDELSDVDEGIWSRIGASSGGLIGVLSLLPPVIILIPWISQTAISYVAYKQFGVIQAITVDLLDIPVLALTTTRVILAYSYLKYLALRKHGLSVGSVTRKAVTFLYYATTPLLLYSHCRSGYHVFMFIRDGIVLHIK